MPALLAVSALVLASIAVSQLWRLHIPYEYRRAVYPFGLAVALLVGAAAARLSRWAVVAPLGAVVVHLLSPTSRSDYDFRSACSPSAHRRRRCRPPSTPYAFG